MTDPSRPENPTPEPPDPSGQEHQVHAEAERVANAHTVEAIHTDPALRGTEKPATDAEERTVDARLRVQWVRPSELAARAGARILEGGIDLNQHTVETLRRAAAQARRDAVGALRRALSHREQTLTPDASTSVTAPVVARPGASR